MATFKFFDLCLPWKKLHVQYTWYRLCWIMKEEVYTICHISEIKTQRTLFPRHLLVQGNAVYMFYVHCTWTQTGIAIMRKRYISSIHKSSKLSEKHFVVKSKNYKWIQKTKALTKTALDFMFWILNNLWAENRFGKIQNVHWCI